MVMGQKPGTQTVPKVIAGIAGFLFRQSYGLIAGMTGSGMFIQFIPSFP